MMVLVLPAADLENDRVRKEDAGFENMVAIIVGSKLCSFMFLL